MVGWRLHEDNNILHVHIYIYIISFPHNGMITVRKRQSRKCTTVYSLFYVYFNRFYTLFIWLF